MSPALTIALLVVGATGITGQIVLMRELLVCFFGNELSLGIIMASWLLLEAAGSWLAGKLISPPGSGDAGRKSGSLLGFGVVAGLAALALPGMVYLVRVIRPLLGLAAGEVVGPPAMLLISLLALLPVSLLHGAGFTLGIRAAETVSRVYVTETLGSIIGGLLLSLLLIGRLGSFDIAFLFVAANFAALGILVSARRPVVSVLAVLALGAVAAIPARLASALDRSALHRLYPGQQVIWYGNSHYGNITVLKREGQYTFLADGAPGITLPVPDYTFVEDFVHFPMLAHPQPHRVLLIGGGLGGVLTEILKYPDVEIDYCELDPGLVGVVRSILPDQPEFAAPRVSLKTVDARRLLRETPGRTYDVIMVSFLSPTALQTNRYFSREFLNLARSRLKDNGLLASLAPGSTAYLSNELARLNRLQLNTLQNVFPVVRLVPGDFSIFLASVAETGALDARVLGQRLRAYGFPTRLVSADYLALRLSPIALQSFRQRLEQVPDPGLNSDARPIGVLAALAYWVSRTNSGMAHLLDGPLENRGRRLPYVLGASIGVLGLIWFGLSRRRRMAALGFAVFTTGFAGATASLLALLLVQIAAGALYLYLALVTTCFMIGIALGGTWSPRLKDRRIYLLESGSSVACLAVVAGGSASALPVTLMLSLLLLLTGVAGLLLGAEYPLVNRIRAGPDGSSAAVAGTLYAADLMGGFLAALIVPLLFVPTIGMLPTALIAGGLKLVSIALLGASAPRQA